MIEIEELTEENEKAEVETVEPAPNGNEDAVNDTEKAEESEVDFAEIIEQDLRELREEFPNLGDVADITELKNPLRYGELRDLGLSPKEAYLASGGAKARYDTRSHLTGSVPRSAASGGRIPRHELNVMKDLFDGISEKELERLYKKVTR